jgi:hypothetical protein
MTTYLSAYMLTILSIFWRILRLSQPSVGYYCKINVMGIVEWFLGVHFPWRITSSMDAVYLNQLGFATSLVESFSCKTRNKTPMATPHWFSIPIDSIAPSLDDDDSPAQLATMQGCIPKLHW